MDLHIRDVLKKYIKQDKRVGDAYYTQKINSFWKMELGDSINSRTSELRYKNGKLSISVTSAPLRHELFNNREKLIIRINAFLKEDIVHVIDLS